MSLRIRDPKLRRLLLALLAAVFVLLMVPAWLHAGARDPYQDHFTDHIRYRYCASLMLKYGPRAVAEPLRNLYAIDDQPHKELLWESEPCHHGGVVQVLVHAPFQWALNAGWLDPPGATLAYVALVLLCALASVHLILTRTDHGWVLLAFGPLLVTMALIAVQSPISMLLGLAAVLAWVRGARVPSLVLFTLLLSHYSRWVVWVPGIAWLAWLERDALASDLQRRLRTPAGWALLAACSVVLAVTAILVIVVMATREPPPGNVITPDARIWVAACLLFWAGWWWLRRDSRLAPFMISFAAFFVTYAGEVNFFYVTPMLPLFPLARTAPERLAWFAWVVAIRRRVFGFDWLDWLGIAHWALDGWRQLL